MGTSPDELRIEIEATRARLSDDLDHLADRVSPRRVAGRQRSRMRGAADGMRRRLRRGHDRRSDAFEPTDATDATARRADKQPADHAPPPA